MLQLKAFQQLIGHNPFVSWMAFNVKHLQEVVSFIVSS